jgi:hypothetical protein
MTKRRFYTPLCSIILSALLSVFSMSAWAACVSPAGQAGDMIYNQSNRVLQWCDGTSWYAAGQIDPAGPNDGCITPVGVGGDIIYNQAEHILQYCDGDHWQGVAGGVDKAPDGFTFVDLTNQTQSTQVTSNIVTILGIAVATDVTISGEGTPQFRIAGGAWVTSGNITNGQTLQLRLTTPAALSTTNTATVIVGTVAGTWSASTVGSDTVPNAFGFTDQTGVALNSLRSSNTITISGINSSTPVSVSGGGGAQISINGGAWGTSGNISNNQTLQVRQTASSSTGTTLTATVTVGGVSDGWSVATSSQGYYFVMTNGTWNANLGGKAGADAKCLTDLQANSWLGKANVTLNASTVKAWLCDSTNGCPGMKLGTNYKFARSGSATDGGANLAIDASGRGPNNSTAWNGATYFNASAIYWTGRSDEECADGTGTYWSVCSTLADCSDWTSASTGSDGAQGSSATTDDNRWTRSANDHCSVSSRLVCAVTDNGGGNGSTGAVEIVSTDTEYNINGLATYTFTGMAIGAASTDRLVVALISGRDGGNTGRTISSVTIGGIAATQARLDTRNNSGSEISGIYVAMIPTGTTANVVVNYNAAIAKMHVTLVAVKGVSSATATSSAGATSAGGVTLSATGLNIPANGILFSVGAINGTRTTTMTGITEKVDAIYDNAMHAAGWTIFPSVQSAKTVTYTFSGSALDRSVLSAASFGP